MSDTPRTDIRHCEACGQVRFPSDHWQRQLAAAIEQRDQAREDALEQAAKVCDRLRNKNYSSEDERWVAGTDDCAAAIRRAMKECAK